MICEEREGAFKQELDIAKPIFPYKYYEENIPFQKLIDIWETSKDYLDDEDLEKLETETPNSIVYRQYRKEESVGCPHYICGCE